MYFRSHSIWKACATSGRSLSPQQTSTRTISGDCLEMPGWAGDETHSSRKVILKQVLNPISHFQLFYQKSSWKWNRGKIWNTYGMHDCGLRELIEEFNVPHSDHLRESAVGILLLCVEKDEGRTIKMFLYKSSLMAIQKIRTCFAKTQFPFKSWLHVWLCAGVSQALKRYV